MQRRVAIWAIVLALLAVPWGFNARASHLNAAKIPIHAHLSASEVHANDELTLTLQTVKGAHLLLHVTYPSVGGFNKKGKTDKNGNWTHSWAVHAHATGDATAQLLVIQGSKHRYYTLHFTVVEQTTDTPTSIPTSTNTAVPTPTNTSAITATSTATGTPGPVSITASVDKTSPAITDSVTVTGKFTVGGVAVSGATMNTTWHFNTGSQQCTGTAVTDSNGNAHCTVSFIGALAGNAVTIDVSFTFSGQTFSKTAAAQFTPSNGPTATPTATITRTLTPTLTPTPTRTPTITPTLTPTVQPYSISAGVDTASPFTTGTVTITGVFTSGTTAISGASMSLILHFQSGAQTFSDVATSGGNGMASHGVDLSTISPAPAAGYTVHVDVSFDYNGHTYTATNATELTPHA
jgi:hypothetical protein